MSLIWLTPSVWCGSQVAHHSPSPQPDLNCQKGDVLTKVHTHSKWWINYTIGLSMLLRGNLIRLDPGLEESVFFFPLRTVSVTHIDQGNSTQQGRWTGAKSRWANLIEINLGRKEKSSCCTQAESLPNSLANKCVVSSNKSKFWC